MLSFLRKIRRSLIDSGSARKYLFYAIGEIALVVIGILIALQINNWNEEGQRKETIKIFLFSLKSEIESDLIRLRRSKGSQIFKFYSSQYLLESVGQSPVKLNSDEKMLPFSENRIWKGPLPDDVDRQFLELTFLWSGRPDLFLPAKNTIEELKNTGLYSYLSLPVKAAINNYYTQYDWRSGEMVINNTNDDIRNWSKSLYSSGIITHDLSAVNDPLLLIKDNPERVALIRVLIRRAWWHTVSQDLLIDLASETILLIEDEIKNF